MTEPAPTVTARHLSPVKVLFDAHQLGRRQTGNETYVRELLTAFRGRNDVSLVAAVEAGAIEHESVTRLVRHRVPRNGWLRLAAMTIAARADRVDVVHAIYFAPYLSGRPLVLSVHDVSYEIHPEFFSRSERWRNQVLIRNGSRRARFVVTISETSRIELIERYDLNPDRVIAIHCGVSEAFSSTPAREILPIGDRPISILAVGTLQPRKNLARLLSAIREVAAVRPVELLVIGPDGYQAAAIRDAIAEVAEVRVLGYLSDEDLRAQYGQADMLVYPSIYEGFGLPVVEAMASGLPVVTTTGGALPEVAGDAATIVDPLDVSAIAAAILQLADDTELRRARSLAGRARAASFSWSDAADKLVAVYRRAAND